jgi:dsDNA-specific endonuclease/ATPase MutS2
MSGPLETPQYRVTGHCSASTKEKFRFARVGYLAVQVPTRYAGSTHDGTQKVPGNPPAGRKEDAGRVKLKLDLHDIYNRGADIDRALQAIMAEAVAKKAPLVEIIPGKGSGQLKKRVLRYLNQKEVRALYHRVEKDSDNFGRIFVHFRWK